MTLANIYKCISFRIIFVIVITLSITFTSTPLSAKNISNSNLLASSDSLTMSDFYDIYYSGAGYSSYNNLTISDASDFQYFQSLLNSGCTFEGITITQTCDIALSSFTFKYDETVKRICIYDESNSLVACSDSDGYFYDSLTQNTPETPAQLGLSKCLIKGNASKNFKGVYNGNSHTISNALLQNTNPSYTNSENTTLQIHTGIFGNLDETSSNYLYDFSLKNSCVVNAYGAIAASITCGNSGFFELENYGADINRNVSVSDTLFFIHASQTYDSASMFGELVKYGGIAADLQYTGGYSISSSNFIVENDEENPNDYFRLGAICSDGISLHDCQTKDIEITATNEAKNQDLVLYIGGLASTCSNLNNCTSDTEVKISDTIFNYGGISSDCNSDTSNRSLISNCTATGTLTASSENILNAEYGGIAALPGFNKDIVDCENNITAYLTNYTGNFGGITAYSDAMIQNDTELNINHCINNGNVNLDYSVSQSNTDNSTSAAYIGGILGSAVNSVKIINCINNGDTSAGSNSGSTSDLAANFNLYSGGILGHSSAPSAYKLINNINYGNCNSSDITFGGLVANSINETSTENLSPNAYNFANLNKTLDNVLDSETTVESTLIGDSTSVNLNYGFIYSESLTPALIEVENLPTEVSLRNCYYKNDLQEIADSMNTWIKNSENSDYLKVEVSEGKLIFGDSSPCETKAPSASPSATPSASPKSSSSPSPSASPSATPKSSGIPSPSASPMNSGSPSASPNSSSNPSASNSPDTSAVPDTSSAPDSSENPSASNEPANTSAPDISTTNDPASSSTPNSNASSEPAGSTNPDSSNASDNSGTTENSDNSSTTETLKNSSSSQSATASPTPTSASDASTTVTTTTDETVESPKNLKITYDKKLHPILTWDETENADGYSIYRSQKKNKNFIEISTTSDNEFSDTNAKKGNKYFYKIKSYINTGSVTYSNRGDIAASRILSSDSKIVKLELPYFEAPKISLKKTKSSSNSTNYLKVSFKKFSGSCMEIYIKKPGGKFSKLPLKSSKLSDYGNNPLLSYSKSGTKVKIKARTYVQDGDEKKFSDYSKTYSITL
ncbi:MAG: hypothetical protein K6F77_00545 [Lachnospiraceae bacterium]|nr:hypothetical protein [Lachnospiraceae bacterium]